MIFVRIYKCDIENSNQWLSHFKVWNNVSSQIKAASQVKEIIYSIEVYMIQPKAKKSVIKLFSILQSK